MKFSVIISTYNEPEITALHVRECMKASVLPDEIIVVNDGGEDKVREELLKIERKCKIIYAKIIQDITANHPGAKNLGVWLSSGEYIVTEDADHFPSVDFYKEAIEKLDVNSEIHVAYSGNRNKIKLAEDFSSWTIIKRSGPAYGIGMIRRKSLMKMKGYDERFSGEYGWHITNFIRKLRFNNLVAVKCSWYYVVQKPTDGIKWKTLSVKNSHIDVKDKRFKTTQSPLGILNFNYTFEEWEKNCPSSLSITQPITTSLELVKPT